jgi:MFS family permease
LSPWLTGARAVQVFGCFAFAYLMSFVLRSVSAVIAPELVHEYSLSNSQLGSLGSVYFIAFAAMQLPLGVWLDRYGSRRTHSALLLLTAAGCLMFAFATQPAILWVARALIGAGVAGALMAALKAYRFWYRPQQQQQLAAWMLMIGSLGALLATVPTRWAMAQIGWRGVFVVAGLLTLSAAALIFVRLPRDEERARLLSTPADAAATSWHGYREVFSASSFWRFAMVSVLTHSFFISLQSLWAGPWLIEVSGLQPDAAAQVLFVFNLFLIAGFAGVGALMPWVGQLGWSVVSITAIGTAIVVGLELAIALLPERAWWPLWPLLGLATTFFAIVQPHVSLSFRPALTGRAYTAYNLLIFTGIFGAQWLYGVLIDALLGAGYGKAMAFQGALLVFVSAQLLGLVAFCAWPWQASSHTPAQIEETL